MAEWRRLAAQVLMFCMLACVILLFVTLVMKTCVGCINGMRALRDAIPWRWSRKRQQQQQQQQRRAPTARGTPSAPLQRGGGKQRNVFVYTDDEGQTWRITFLVERLVVAGSHAAPAAVEPAANALVGEWRPHDQYVEGGADASGGPDDTEGGTVAAAAAAVEGGAAGVPAVDGEDATHLFGDPEGGNGPAVDGGTETPIPPPPSASAGSSFRAGDGQLRGTVRNRRGK